MGLMLSLTLGRLSQKMVWEQPCLLRTKEDLKVLKSSVNNPAFLWPAAAQAVHGRDHSRSIIWNLCSGGISRPLPLLPAGAGCWWPCCCPWGCAALGLLVIEGRASIPHLLRYCAAQSFGTLLALAPDSPEPAQLEKAACLWTQSWRTPGDWVLMLRFPPGLCICAVQRSPHSPSALHQSAAGPCAGLLWPGSSWVSCPQQHAASGRSTCMNACFPLTVQITRQR